MLYIDDKKIKIIKQEIYVGTFMKNADKGYNINISLEFINTDNNKKGYINLDVGFEKNNDIRSFLNKEYNGMARGGDDNQFIFFEVFDTEKFLVDSDIESKIIIKLKDMKEGKIVTYFEINDELIKIRFDGYLDINFETTKETFAGYTNKYRKN